MSLNELLKRAVDKVDPDRRLAELRGSAGELAREHGGKVEEVLDKVEAKVDDTTRGKYADRLASARRKITDGVARVAAEPPVEDGESPGGDAPFGEQPRTELPPQD